MTLTIDIISDVICPWCFIGKRRLEKAIAAFDGQATVRWLPFQLNPTMPKDGISRKDYRTKKFGSWERSLELDAQMVAVGETEGIHFAFDRTERTPNTVDAHRLIWLADQQGIQDAVMEALFRAYFSEGRDISNRQTLIDVVAEAGLDRHRAEAVLNSNDGLEAITEAEGLSRRHRVDGVPFFIINGKFTLGGAQPPGVSRCLRSGGRLDVEGIRLASMPRISAGLLMYRIHGGTLQMLLAHPGGPFFKNKDDGAWTIPKGEIEPDEDLLEAVKREFKEETGVTPTGPFIALSPIKQKGGKIVHAWAFKGDCDPSAIVSNTFSIEWPPKSGRQMEFPEMDRADFFDVATARKIKAGQEALIEELEKIATGEPSRGN